MRLYQLLKTNNIICPSTNFSLYLQDTYSIGYSPTQFNIT